MTQEIATRGPRAVVEELYGSGDRWETVLRQVEAGEETWLRAAVALRPGTDAGSTSELRDAVSVALANAPTNVLHIAVPTFEVREICSGRQDPLPTYDAALAELEKTVVAVKAVESPDLSKVRGDCLRSLKRARSDLKRFFNKG